MKLLGYCAGALTERAKLTVGERNPRPGPHIGHSASHSLHLTYLQIQRVIKENIVCLARGPVVVSTHAVGILKLLSRSFTIGGHDMSQIYFYDAQSPQKTLFKLI